jgi:hypothetical protein
MGTGECAPLTVGVAVVGDRVGAAVVGTAVVGDEVGAAEQAQSVSRRREGALCEYPANPREFPASKPPLVPFEYK